MADLNFLNFVGPTMNIIGMVIIFIFVAGIAVVGVLAYLQYKRYNTPVWIFYYDAFGKLHLKTDKGGIFVHGKSKKKLFFLKTAKVGMNPDKIPYLTMQSKSFLGPTLTKYVFLFQHGLKNLAYIQPNVTNPNMNLTVTEEDLNWYLHDVAVYEKMFKQESLLMQLLPILGFIVAAMMIIILIWLVLKKFDVLQDVSANLLEAAKELAKARAGTVVVQ